MPEKINLLRGKNSFGVLVHSNLASYFYLCLHGILWQGHMVKEVAHSLKAGKQTEKEELVC